MGRVISPQPQPATLADRHGLRRLAVTAAVLGLFALSAPLPGQAPADPSAAQQKPAHAHKRPSPAHHAAVPAPVLDPTAPVTPPEPEKPNWPAFAQPSPATVTWDSHGLTIDAANSSLQQILKDFSTATGAKVEGLTADQRVFGAYGPGKARDVLSQLLQGSGYDILMVGDQGHGLPRTVVFSVRQNGGGSQPQPGRTVQQTDDEEEEQPVAQEPEQPVTPAFPPGAPPRSPQQIMQEMQQRQQEMQRRQNQQNQPQ